MKQYEYAMRFKEQNYTVFCTAPSQEWALLQVKASYLCFDVNPVPVNVREPHTVGTEIDAHDMNEDTATYLVGVIERARQVAMAGFVPPT